MSTRDASSAFESLHPKLQEWIWARGWTQLRDAQERAVPIVLPGDRDLIIAAATAAGKTEAAFFPVCSAIAEPTGPGIQALYIGPLKALINDQFQRLEDLCRHLGVSVHRWHGDVAGNKKKDLLKDPKGILLITPESLEALFVIHGHRLPQVFKPLRYVVVDELHAFVGTERGRQLQSLLHRLELCVRRKVARIGLSATLGDMDLAREALRPRQRDRVELIQSVDDGQELQIQVRGYRERAIDDRQADLDERADGDVPENGARMAIAQHLFKHLRGTNNLVFANSRETVEQIADLCRRLCDDERLPNEFWAHHGSLAKEIREDAEDRLKDTSLPSTAVCTSTLEMGIDIGSVKTVAQIGPPFSVAALRQRLGRSGRKEGEPAILRMYIEEPELTENSSLLDGLHLDLIQSIASVELLLQGWCEPPDLSDLHLSTLIQQVMSLIAQCGGVLPKQAFEVLCTTGPFDAVDAKTFSELLLSMGENDLIQQSDDGTLLLGIKGERIVQHYSFFAAFQSVDEVRVIHEGRLLGTVSPMFALDEGMFLVLAGRRWRVVASVPEDGLVEVEPAPGGRVPKFDGSSFALVHDRVRQEMRSVVSGLRAPAYLDEQAASILREARTNFSRLGLTDDFLLRDGRDAILFVWMGDRIVTTIARMIGRLGLSVSARGPTVTIERSTIQDAREALRGVAQESEATVERIAASGAPCPRLSKYDGYLSDALAGRAYASRMIDTRGAIEYVRRLCS